VAQRKTSKIFLFSQSVVDWYDDNGRKALPWKSKRIAKKHRPYHIWLSEVMLQQTQVTTVIPYYQRFIKAFPNLKALANATQDEVLALWAGLGYYARGRNLHKAAQSMWQEYKAIPNDFDALLKQSGIGRSTAGAIMAQAYDQQFPILDGNVKRVLARYHSVEGWPGKTTVAKELWSLAETHTPKNRVADYTQAIMDLGALVCKRSKPLCDECPLRKKCVAYKTDRQTELPTSKPKKEKPLKSVHVLCLIYKDEVLLEQRPPSGIWGGLWSLPEFASLQNMDDYLQDTFNKNESNTDSLESFRHMFSHYHLDIYPHVLTLSAKMYKSYNTLVQESSQTFFPLGNERAVGVPAPMQRLLENLI